MAPTILSTVFHAVALIAWSLFLADLGPNETQVLLAAIGAIASVINTVYLSRARRDRKKQNAKVAQAIDRGGLVAMVPEKVVREIEGNQARDRRAGDQAP